MSEMEEEVRSFLKKVLITICATLLWLLINMTVGIYGGWLFTYGIMRLGNIIFYLWLITSLAALIWLYIRIWKQSAS